MFSWFKKKKEVFLSPEVNGVVTDNGTPVANLEIIRSLIYIDEKVHRDTANTDQNGRFHFPKKTIFPRFRINLSLKTVFPKKYLS